jgi:large subunit ribosomal protein L2
MAVKEYKPTTPARRGMSGQDFDAITAKKPLKSLVVIKKGSVGRNNQGRITIRHRGGGARRYYRIVNFKIQAGTTATIEQIEYDPNRSAHLARIKDDKGNYQYILAAKGMKVGRKITAADDAGITRGNRLPLKNIPTGTTAQIRLPSGEVRMVSLEAMASIGPVGNEQHQNVKLGKAGRKRHMGVRPTVHGKAMNPADHPMGGGEGKTGPGRIPRTP